MRTQQGFPKWKWIGVGVLVILYLIFFLKLNEDYEAEKSSTAIAPYYVENRAEPQRVSQNKLELQNNQAKERIVFGIVSCDKTGTTKTSDMAVVLIKSVLISASLNKVSIIAFHIFLESMERQAYFTSKVKEYGYPNEDLQVEMHFHSAPDAIPEGYHNKMVYAKYLRCSFVRLFMASNLPNEDAIIYLDTDNIITGNIRNVWNLFSGMNERQLIGIAPASEPWDKNFDPIFKFHFADIPHVPPKGLNSGVLLMNLTKMRKYGWKNKMFQMYNYYSKHLDIRSDQRVLNILLYFERDLLKLIPCQYNYAHIHCEHGQICMHAELNPNGIEILHGAGGQFVNEKSSLYRAFRMYRDFNLTYREAREQLMLPIRKFYEEPKMISRCFGSLNRLLFKNYF